MRVAVIVPACAGCVCIAFAGLAMFLGSPGFAVLVLVVGIAAGLDGVFAGWKDEA